MPCWNFPGVHSGTGSLLKVLFLSRFMSYDSLPACSLEPLSLSNPKRFPSYLNPFLIFPFHLFPSISSLSSLSLLSWHLQEGSRLTFSWPFSYISFSSFTSPGAPYRIFHLFLPRLPCHFYLVVIRQQQPVKATINYAAFRATVCITKMSPKMTKFLLSQKMRNVLKYMKKQFSIA